MKYLLLFLILLNIFFTGLVWQMKTVTEAQVIKTNMLDRAFCQILSDNKLTSDFYKCN